jgi:hypothetical protein
MLTSILALHIAAGSVALAAMWVPMVARKGAPLHRRAGWLFVAAMAAVSATALVLAGARFLVDARAEARQAGLFLLFVSVLTAASVSTGVRVLRAKRRTGLHLDWWDVGLSALLAASSAGLAVYGLAAGRTLFVVFAGIGLANGVGQLLYWLRPPASPMHWWFQHMSSMLGGCIAAATAFLVVNAERWGLGTFSLLVWIAPSVVGTPAIALWSAYYRRKFSGASRHRGAPAVAAS